MFPTEPGGQRPLLERVVDGGGLLEDVSEGDGHPAPDLRDEEGVGRVLGHLAPGGHLGLGRVDEDIVTSWTRGHCHSLVLLSWQKVTDSCDNVYKDVAMTSLEK